MHAFVFASSYQPSLSLSLQNLGVFALAEFGDFHHFVRALAKRQPDLLSVLLLDPVSDVFEGHGCREILFGLSKRSFSGLVDLAFP